MTEGKNRVWLGLGSNLNDPAMQLQDALVDLDHHPALDLLQVSRFYRTAPVGGPPGQPVFCNAAATLATSLTPEQLLRVLQAIEATHGRVRDIRWGPRTLDLDILACEGLTLEEPELQIPHPRAHERAFVLQPLSELAPDLELGCRGRVADCLAAVGTRGVVLWGSAPSDGQR